MGFGECGGEEDHFWPLSTVQTQPPSYPPLQTPSPHLSPQVTGLSLVENGSSPRARRNKQLPPEVFPQPRPGEGCLLMAGMENQGSYGKNTCVHTRHLLPMVSFVRVK